jgi:hypothetical protein
MSALRGATAATAAAVPVAVRPATLADFDRLAGHLSALAGLGDGER